MDWLGMDVAGEADWGSRTGRPKKLILEAMGIEPATRGMKS